MAVSRGGNRFIVLTGSYNSSTSKAVRGRTQGRNLETGITAEAMEDSLPPMASSASFLFYRTQDNQPKNGLGPLP